MSAFHNSLPGEKLALGWHLLGLIVSTNISMFALISAIMLYPFTAGESIAGFLVYCLWLVLCADVIVGLGGILWHIKAIFDHRENLRRLQAGGING